MNQYFIYHLTANAGSGRKERAEAVVARLMGVYGRMWCVLGLNTTDEVSANLGDSDVSAGKHTGKLKCNDLSKAVAWVPSLVFFSTFQTNFPLKEDPVRRSTAYTLLILLVTLVLFACLSRTGNVDQSADIVQKMINLPEEGGIILTVVDPVTGGEYTIEARRLGGREMPNPKSVQYVCPKICTKPVVHCCTNP